LSTRQLAALQTAILVESFVKWLIGLFLHKVVGKLFLSALHHPAHSVVR
jgi:hypothetical protein